MTSTTESMTVQEAVTASPYREDFDLVLSQFAARASRHERVTVYWWHGQYAYVGIVDDRKEYPLSMRALISFDTANGTWAGHDSACRYAFARRGWGRFLDNLSDYPVSRYSG